MDLHLQAVQLRTRRQFLKAGSLGLGAAALAALLGEGRAAPPVAEAPGSPLAPKSPHIPAKAKRVIYLHMSGAPPQHELFLYTGSARNGGAAMGSWITYGLGSESQDLPGFVVLISGGTDPTGGKALWSTGYLPSVFQGVQCRSGAGDPILYVNNPPGM